MLLLGVCMRKAVYRGNAVTASLLTAVSSKLVCNVKRKPAKKKVSEDGAAFAVQKIIRSRSRGDLSSL